MVCSYYCLSNDFPEVYFTYFKMTDLSCKQIAERSQILFGKKNIKTVSLLLTIMTPKPESSITWNCMCLDDQKLDIYWLELNVILWFSQHTKCKFRLCIMFIF